MLRRSVCVRVKDSMKMMNSRHLLLFHVMGEKLLPGMLPLFKLFPIINYQISTNTILFLSFGRL